MPHYRSLVSSLYSSLDAEVIHLVERAIWLNKTGHYEEALAIFNEDLASSHLKEIPAVLVEKSNLFLDRGKYGEVYRLLEGPLRDKNHDRDKLDRPEWRLLALNWVIVMTRHKGILEPALAELERTSLWLRDVPVAEYSDIQVRYSLQKL